MDFYHVLQNVLSKLKFPVAVLPTVILSLAIISSSSLVLVTINKSQRATQTQHFFFITNVMSANIMATIMKGVIEFAASLKVVSPTINIIRCKVLGVGVFPILASFYMVVALCLDRIFTVMAPGMYKKVMTKTLAWGIAAAVWIMSCGATYAGISSYALADLEDGTCNTKYLEEFEIKAIISPLIISGVVAAVHNIFIFYQVFTTTTLDDRRSTRRRFNKLCKAWRIYMETQPISITLLILGVYNIAGGIYLISIGSVQSSTDLDEQVRDTIVEYCTYDYVDTCMLMQSMVYVKFLHTIEEHL